MQIIPQPLPRQHLLNIQPRSTISQRRKEPETPNSNRQKRTRSSPRSHQTSETKTFLGRHEARTEGDSGFLVVRYGVLRKGLGVEVEDEFDQGARDESGCEMSGEVVVEETLADHEVEWEIVSRPAEEEEACAVVEAGTGSLAPD